MLTRLPRNAPVWLDRLSTWLEPFEICFTHVAQRGAFRRYLLGLLSDSRRKSMSAMLERVSDPGTYQAFQHFITDAPWSAERVWRTLRERIPERSGMLILDGTSFPKQGRRSVAVARQYCGSLGKVANCQVAVTAALWTGVRAWMLGAALYLPEEWLTPELRQRARIPATIRFQEKWRLALTLLRQIRAAGFDVTAVLGDEGAQYAVLFAFQVLPTIIFIAALFAILYYVGLMQLIVRFFAVVMRRFMKASGAESLNVAASIFMGQTEAPLTIRPFLAGMTQSELMTVMTSGMAHISGGIMAAYILFGIEAQHLLTAVIMTACATDVRIGIDLTRVGITASWRRRS